MVTLYNKVSLVHVLINNEQWLYHTIYSSLLMLVNGNIVAQCLFVSVLTLILTNKTCDFNNALVNANIIIN